MLLPATFLIFLSLRLSKAERHHAKRCFYLIEKMARIMEQLSFLKTACRSNLIPPSINNIRLPKFFEEEGMKNSKRYIKKFILRKNIRFLHGQLEKTRRKSSAAVESIFAIHEMDKATRICSAIEEAFQVSMQHHKNRLTKKLAWIKRKEEKITSPQISTQNYQEDMVTDLTKSLSEEEITLLSKGPKFAVSSAIRSIDVQANFCLVANQLRWLYYMSEKKTDTTDGNNFTMPKFPNREHIYEPPAPNQALETKLRYCFVKIQAQN